MAAIPYHKAGCDRVGRSSVDTSIGSPCLEFKPIKFNFLIRTGLPGLLVPNSSSLPLGVYIVLSMECIRRASFVKVFILEVRDI